MIVNGVPLTVVGVLEPPFDPDRAPSDGYFISADLFIPVGAVSDAERPRRRGAGDARRRPPCARRHRRAGDR